MARISAYFRPDAPKITVKLPSGKTVRMYNKTPQKTRIRDEEDYNFLKDSPGFTEVKLDKRRNWVEVPGRKVSAKTVEAPSSNTVKAADLKKAIEETPEGETPLVPADPVSTAVEADPLLKELKSEPDLPDNGAEPKKKKLFSKSGKSEKKSKKKG
jgi:hypothetical protein